MEYKLLSIVCERALFSLNQIIGDNANDRRKIL